MYKPHKYRAVKTIIDGIAFPSKLEANVYCHLKMLEKQGILKDIRLQQRVDIDVPIAVIEDGKIQVVNRVRSKVDFKVFDKALNQDVWVEAKGVETSHWRKFKTAWKKMKPGILRIYKANHRGVYMSEEIGNP